MMKGSLSKLATNNNINTSLSCHQYKSYNVVQVTFPSFLHLSQTALEAFQLYLK